MVKPIYIFLFLFVLLIFVTHYRVAGQGIYGDGIDYWAYLPSLYFDHDLDFTNQYTHTYSPENNNRFQPTHAPTIQKTHFTPTGRVDNPHTPGTALLWLPAFITADILSSLLHLPRTGYSDIYQIGVAIWSILLIIGSLILSERTAATLVKDAFIARLSVAGLFLATPLLYYGSYDLLNSHWASFCLASVFWYLIIVKPSRFLPHASLILGFVVGIATLVRLQDALLLLPASIFIFTRSHRPAWSIFSLVFAWVLCLTPLFLIWNYLYDIPYPLTYTSIGHVYRGLFNPFFHRTNGLLFRTPLLLFCLIGLKALIKHFPSLALITLPYLLLNWLLVAYQGGWRDAAYGGRMFISTLPVFLLLLALTLQLVQNRWHKRTALIVVICFALLNIISAVNFVLFEKQVNSGQKTGLEEQTILKLNQFLMR